MSDQHTPDGEATDEPTLSPEEDAAVAALLAALPTVTVPDEVAARIQSALAEETPLSGPVPAWASGGGSVSVLPSPREREQRQRRSARSARILSAAAGVALVLGTVAVGSQFLGGDADSGGSVATGAPERDVADDAGSDGALLQNSGATFSATALTSQVESLADAAEQPGADLVDVQAAQASGGGPSSPEPNAAAYDATDIAVSPTALGICLGKLAEGGSDTPVAVDAGTWESTPPGESSVRRVAAAVVVLRGEDPRTLDAYVVGALCADPTVLDAQVLFYRAVPRD